MSYLYRNRVQTIAARLREWQRQEREEQGKRQKKIKSKKLAKPLRKEDEWV